MTRAMIEIVAAVGWICALVEPVSVNKGIFGPASWVLALIVTGAVLCLWLKKLEGESK